MYAMFSYIHVHAEQDEIYMKRLGAVDVKDKGETEIAFPCTKPKDNSLYKLVKIS